MGNFKLDRVVGFLFSGIAALLTDILIFEMLIWSEQSLLNTVSARVISIVCAMFVGWRCHRRFTFKLQSRPNWKEFAAYCSVAWIAILINFLLFLLILKFANSFNSSLAIVLSSLVAMCVSYLGMRFGVFRKQLAQETEQ